MPSAFANALCARQCGADPNGETYFSRPVKVHVTLDSMYGMLGAMGNAFALNDASQYRGALAFLMSYQEN